MKWGMYLLFIVLLWGTPALAEEPVQFGSAELKSLVEKVLDVNDPTPTDMLALEVVEGDPLSVGSLAGLEYAHNLRAIYYLPPGRITDLGPLRNLVKLQTMELPNQRIIDLSPLAGLTALTNLSLSGNQIVDVAPLANLVNLRGLGLGENQIVDVAPLANLVNLRGLGLSENQIRDVSALSALPNLESLGLSSNQIQELKLSELPRLKELSADNNPLVTLDLSGLPALESLQLSHGQIRDVRLAGASNLQKLNLANNQVTRLTLAELANPCTLNLASNQLTDLRVVMESGTLNFSGLNLSGNWISDLTPLARLTGLTSLDLSWNLIEDIHSLSGMQRLATVNLAGNRIAAVALTDLPILGTLDLRNNWIADTASLARLGALPKLFELRLSDNPIGAMSIPATPIEFAGLKTLALSHSQIGSIHSLIGLMYLPAVENLDLSGNQLRDLVGLSWHTTLMRLGLADNEISDLAPLGELGLRSLDCSNNQVTDLSPLAGLSDLDSLDMSKNQIADISPLSKLDSLRHADLAGNQISGTCVLSGLSHLTRLDLSDNRITEIQLSELPWLNTLHLENNLIGAVQGLTDLPNLGDLNLENNLITDLGPLASWMNPSLSYLALSGNPLNEAAYAQDLPEVLAQHPGLFLSFPNCTAPGFVLTVSATDGGQVTFPGEGPFAYAKGGTIGLWAEPSGPEYRFVGWSGTAVEARKVQLPQSSITTVTIDADYTLQANFEPQ